MIDVGKKFFLRSAVVFRAHHRSGCITIFLALLYFQQYREANLEETSRKVDKKGIKS